MAKTTPPDELPLGTSPAYERMHKIIRRVCYVLLFGLVIEGTLTFPALAIWYGVPELTPTEVCSELQKVRFNDDTRECEFPVPLSHAPFGGPAEGEGQTTAQDRWGVQPTPGYPTVRFRELVEKRKERKEREAREAEEDKTDENAEQPAG